MGGVTNAGAGQVGLITSAGAIEGGGGGGGGSNSVLLSWGGYSAGTNQFFDAFGPYSGGVVNTTANEESTITAPFAGTVTTLVLNLSSGNTDQVFELWVNGVSKSTTSPGATEVLHYGVYTIASVDVAKGDALTLTRTAGTASAETGVQVVLTAS